MSKRLRWLLGLTLLAVAGTAVFAYLLYPRSAINRENFEKIREGMTLAEVEAILGGEQRDESTGFLMTIGEKEDGILIPAMVGPMTISSRDRIQVWANDYAVIRMDFGWDGRIRSSQFWAVRPAEESLIGLLRRWLRL